MLFRHRTTRENTYSILLVYHADAYIYIIYILVKSKIFHEIYFRRYENIFATEFRYFLRKKDEENLENYLVCYYLVFN